MFYSGLFLAAIPCDFADSTSPRISRRSQEMWHILYSLMHMYVQVCVTCFLLEKYVDSLCRSVHTWPFMQVYSRSLVTFSVNWEQVRSPQVCSCVSFKDRLMESAVVQCSPHGTACNGIREFSNVLCLKTDRSAYLFRQNHKQIFISRKDLECLCLQ